MRHGPSASRKSRHDAKCHPVALLRKNARPCSTIRMRGEYAAIHEAIVDDPDFKKLSPAAKCCWYTLRLMLGASGIALLRASRIILADSTGLAASDLHPALNELVDGKWLIVQGDVLWLRNALRHNPTLTLTNDNHRKAIMKHLAGLPRLEVVNAFATYYGFAAPFVGLAVAWDSERYPTNGIPHPIPHPIPDPDTGHRSTDTGDTTTTAPGGREGVENGWRGVDRPAYTLGELLVLANERLGLGRLPYPEQGANKRILNDWLYSSSKRDPTEIACAIEGAAAMRDLDLIGWDSARPGAPMTLKALQSAATLANQGDGKAVRRLYDVAAEYARRQDDAPPPTPTARLKTNAMTRAGALLPESAA